MTGYPALASGSDTERFERHRAWFDGLLAGQQRSCVFVCLVALHPVADAVSEPAVREAVRTGMSSSTSALIGCGAFNVLSTGLPQMAHTSYAASTLALICLRLCPLLTRSLRRLLIVASMCRCGIPWLAGVLRSVLSGRRRRSRVCRSRISMGAPVVR